jgi:hypothetical protein
MTEIALGVPIEIDGKEVIIFRDVIGTESLRSGNDSEVLTIVEPEGADGRPPIFIDEGWLIRLRDSYPGIPVYGLWQTLFANGKVPLGNEVIVYPLGETNGLYIRMNVDEDMESPKSILTSSEYIDNFFPDLMEYNFENATRITVDLEDLKLPATPAYTRAEIFERNKQLEQRRWVYVGGFCLVIAIATAVVNYGLYTVHTMKMTSYANKQLELSTLQERLAELQAKRLLSYPNYSIPINRLTELASYDPRLQTPKAGQYGIPTEGVIYSFDNQEHTLVSSEGFNLDLASKFAWLNAARTPEERFIWTFNNSEAGGDGN